MKKIFYILIFLFCIIPINIGAIKADYVDKLSDAMGIEVEENKVNLYLFKDKTCPHCKKETEWLKSIEGDYKDYLNIYYFELNGNQENQEKYFIATETMNVNTNSIPFTVIGEKTFVGFSDTIKSNIENTIKD